MDIISRDTLKAMLDRIDSDPNAVGVNVDLVSRETLMATIDNLVEKATAQLVPALQSALQAALGDALRGLKIVIQISRE